MLVTLYVGDVVPDLAGDAIERKLVSMLDGPSDAIGSRVSRVRREKMPFLGSHWKYRLPDTAPSFLPKKLNCCQLICHLVHSLYLI